VTTTTLARARAGDGEAFGELTEPYRRELQLHCYRILGSVADAEDILQETLLAAWRGLDRFQERASMRTWLYRIATNKCLNALRDVLGYPAAQAAQILETSEVSVNSALQRARAALSTQVPSRPRDRAPAPRSPRERDVVRRFVDAFEAADIDRLVEVLTDDALLTMPPEPLEYRGHVAIARFYLSRTWWGTQAGTLVPTRANGQPAFGAYLRDARAPVARASGLVVLTLAGDKISAITRFGDDSLYPRFGLPRTLRG
jgi:DNA-directed RNA polymerase specialized sigma24 family protein